MKFKMYFQQEICNKQKNVAQCQKSQKLYAKNALTKPPPLSHLEFYFVAIIFLQIHYFIPRQQQ